MRELSLNILDIVENSFKAQASLVEIDVLIGDKVEIIVTDDGYGMEEDFASKVTDPYVTTRTTRPVGLGIPLIKMQAEMCGGEFSLTSQKGKGTKVKATFVTNHLDRPPVGNLAETVVTMLCSLGQSNFVLTFSAEKTFVLDTRELRRELEGVPLDEPAVLAFVKQLVTENVAEACNGKIY